MNVRRKKSSVTENFGRLFGLHERWVTPRAQRDKRSKESCKGLKLLGRSGAPAREGSVQLSIDVGDSAKGSRVPAMRAELSVASLNAPSTPAITARRRAIA